MNIPNNDFGGFTDLAHFLFNVAEPSSSVNISYGSQLGKTLFHFIFFVTLPIFSKFATSLSGI